MKLIIFVNIMEKTVLALGLVLLFPALTIAVENDTTKLNTDYERKYYFGLGAGFNAPYGFGLEVGYKLNENMDINTGVGVNLSGGKVGLGTQYFFSPVSKVSPFLGFNFVQSSGIPELVVVVNQDQAKYRIPSNNVFHAKAGLRFRTGPVLDILGTLGYSVPLNDKEAEYISGSTSSSVKEFANFVSPGGLEVSAKLAFRF